MRPFIPFCLALLSLSLTASAQSTATLTGQVRDPSGASVEGASISLTNSLAGFRRILKTGPDGTFHFPNVPFHTYELHIEKEGFATDERSISLRSNVPHSLTVDLEIAGTRQAISVIGEDRQLVDPEETGSHAQLNQSEIEKLSLRSGARGLESVLVSLPGFAQNANGAIHPRGAHNQMTFVIDGMPISDQLTGAFANAVDPNIVQTVELFTGYIAAEYGQKVSAVANVTTRSGLGSGRRLAGSTLLGASQFSTLSHVSQLAGEAGRFGYSASINTMKSHRYLDQVSLDNLHNGGNSERGFVRLEYQASPADILRLNLLAGRSSFQLANLHSQHLNGQRQRQLLRDLSVSLGWVRVLSPGSTFDATASYRSSITQLFPSPGDTPVTAAQARHLTTVNLANRFNAVRGPHLLRFGLDYQRFPLSENFSFGVTHPGFNPPGSVRFIPTLLAHDLSRGGHLFQFSARDAGQNLSGFLQDQLQWRRFRFALGLRYDDYRFLVTASQWQPRLGVSFHVPETGTVFRASYNRTFQTPPNENLLISNSEAAGVLVPPAVREALGGALVRIRPERQNVFEAGFQQAVGPKLSLSAAFHHKDGWDQQDNDNFFNTGIIFPISLARIRVNGAEARLASLPVHGFSGQLSLTHARAVSTPPFTGGLFLGNSAVQALSSGPFVIDHDQKLSLSAVLQYAHRMGFWGATILRYDSGLVANPSDPAAVARDPDYFDLLPYVDLLSSPPRVRPRTVVDLSLGYERRVAERRCWEITFQVSNLTNRTALYNFQSIFVGTRLIQPRSSGVRLRWYW